MSQANHLSQRAFWERAGEISYATNDHASAEVGAILRDRQCRMGLEIAAAIGMKSEDGVIDVGCGDGAFANGYLADHFARVTGVDFSTAGIERARREAKPNSRFEVFDLAMDDLRKAGKFDGAFLKGILHHIKKRTPWAIMAMRDMCPRVVVLEPNGNHIVRKLLEFTPKYRAAGEDSFRTSSIPFMFEGVGYKTVIKRRFNLFPDFTPKWAFNALRSSEPFIERTPGLRSLCTMNAYGFVAE